MFSALTWPIEPPQPHTGQAPRAGDPAAPGRAHRAVVALLRLQQRLAALLAGNHMSPDRNALCPPAAAQPRTQAGK